MEYKGVLVLGALMEYKGVLVLGAVLEYKTCSHSEFVLQSGLWSCLALAARSAALM